MMAAILNRDPLPMSAIAPRVPPPLDHVVSRCLAKDPDERWQTARDVLHELRWASEDRSAREPAIARAPRPGGMIQKAAWPIAALSLITAAAIGGARWFEAPPVERAVQFEVFPPKGAVFSTGTPGARMAISPDGTMLAFARRRQKRGEPRSGCAGWTPSTRRFSQGLKALTRCSGRPTVDSSASSPIRR